MRGYNRYSNLLSPYHWKYGDPTQEIVELLLQPAVDGWHQAERMFRPAFRLAPRDPLIDRLGSARAIVGIAINAALFAQFVGVTRAGSAAPELLLKPFVTALAGFVVAPLAIVAFIVAAHPAERDETRRQMRWPLRTLGSGVLSCGTLAAIGLLALPASRWVLSLSWWPLILLLCVPPLYILVVRLSGFVLRMVFLVAKYWFNAVDGHPLLAPVVATGVTWAAAAYELVAGGDDYLPGWLHLLTVIGSVVTVTTLATLEGWRVHHMYGVTFRSGPFPAHDTLCRRCGQMSLFAGQVCHDCSPGDPGETAETVASTAVAAVVFVAITWWHWSPPPAGASADGGKPITFTSPSRNLLCELTPGSADNAGAVTARCSATEISYRSPAPPPGCATPGYGHTLILMAGRPAEFSCTPVVSAKPGTKTLAYDKTVALDPITCRSASDGITCRDTSGHGFRIERDSVAILG